MARRGRFGEGKASASYSGVHSGSSLESLCPSRFSLFSALLSKDEILLLGNSGLPVGSRVLKYL